MSTAICTQCGKEISWRATRGTRLANYTSGCCNAPLRAKREVFIKTVKTCPYCQKAGLLWRKALRDPIMSLKPRDGNPYYGACYCPRCEKWVNPIIKKQ